MRTSSTSLADRPAAAAGRGRPFTVGLVGRLAPWKGQDVFLRAFASAFAGGDERAVIAGSALFGEGDWVASLPGLAESLGIAGQVELTGFVDDVGSLYRRLDVLVHASTIPEPFGQVVVEGLPRASLLLAGVTRQVPIRGRGRLAHELHRRFGSTCAFDRDVRLERGHCDGFDVGLATDRVVPLHLLPVDARRRGGVAPGRRAALRRPTGRVHAGRCPTPPSRWSTPS